MPELCTWNFADFFGRRVSRTFLKRWLCQSRNILDIQSFWLKGVWSYFSGLLKSCWERKEGVANRSRLWTWNVQFSLVMCNPSIGAQDKVTPARPSVLQVSAHWRSSPMKNPGIRVPVCLMYRRGRLKRFVLKKTVIIRSDYELIIDSRTAADV